MWRKSNHFLCVFVIYVLQVCWLCGSGLGLAGKFCFVDPSHLVHWISRMLGDCRVWAHLLWPQCGQLALLPVDQPRYASWCGRLIAKMVSVLHTFLYAYCLQRDCGALFIQRSSERPHFLNMDNK